MSLNSPFEEFLHTNYRPSIDEAAQISNYLNQPRDELTRVEIDVRRALRLLQMLRRQQAELRIHIEAHESLIHPIRRLPDELLQEVFRQSLPTYHPPTLSNLSSPLLLTRVCHHWRVLAHATVGLWSSLHIPIPRGRNEEEHEALTNTRKKGVEQWIEWANGAPLSISLYWPPALIHSFGLQERFPSLILSFSRYLRELELDLPDDVLPVFIEAPASDFPLLERIVLRFPCSPDQPSRGLGIADAELWKAPKLTRVVWESVEEDWFRLPLNWKAMKEIDLTSDPMILQSVFSPPDARALLNAIPNIERLKLELSRYPHNRAPPGFGPLVATQSDVAAGDSSSRLPEAEPQNHPLILNHLTSLELTDVYVDSDAGSGFFSNLYLPALTTLVYRCFGLSPFLPSAPSPDRSNLNPPLPSTQRNGLQHQPEQEPLRRVGISVPTHPLLLLLRAQDRVMIKNWKVGATSIPRDAFVECLRLMPLLEKLHVMDSRLFLDFSMDQASPSHSEWSDDDDDEDDDHLENSDDEVMSEVVYCECSDTDTEHGHGRGPHDDEHEVPQQRRRGPRRRSRTRTRYTSMEERYHDTLYPSGSSSRSVLNGKEKMRNRAEYMRIQSLQATEIAPDDGLLRSFVPSKVWWKETWSGLDDALAICAGVAATGRRTGEVPSNDAPSASLGQPDSSSRSLDKGKGRSRSPIRVEENSEPGILVDDMDVIQDERGLDVGHEPREAAYDEVGQDVDMLPFIIVDEAELDDDDVDEPDHRPALSSTSTSQRIPMAIPVDTSDLAAEESEILCPRLTAVRFDRARFTLQALETFVRARRSLSSADAAHGETVRDSKPAQSPSVDGLKDNSRIKLGAFLARGRKPPLERDLHDQFLRVDRHSMTGDMGESGDEGSVQSTGDWESTRFVTARSSPYPESMVEDAFAHPTTSLPVVPEPEMVDMEEENMDTDVAQLPMPFSTSTDPSPAAPAEGSPAVTPPAVHITATVSPIRRIFVGLLYDQPTSDIPRLTRYQVKQIFAKKGGPNAPRNSKLAAMLYEEYDDPVRLTLRFADPNPDHPGPPIAFSRVRQPGVSELGRSSGAGAGAVPDTVSMGVALDYLADLAEDGLNPAAPGMPRVREDWDSGVTRASFGLPRAQTIRNDAREGVRGWTGPGSNVYRDAEWEEDTEWAF